MIYTTIIHPVRVSLGITPFDYCVADIIAKSQANPKYSRDGWCTVSWNTIAGFLGISKQSVLNSKDKLISKDLLLVIGRKKQVASNWWTAFETVKNLYQNDDNGKESLPIENNGKVKKVYLERSSIFTKNGKESLPHNRIKEIKYNSSSCEVKEEDSLYGIDYSFSKKIDGAEKKKIPEKKKSKTASKLSFEESPFSDFSHFKDSFRDTDYEFADLDYYHGRIRAWAADNDVALTINSWLGTARKFMRVDAEKGRLIKRPDLNPNKNGRGRKIIDPEQAYRIIKSDR